MKFVFLIYSPSKQTKMDERGIPRSVFCAKHAFLLFIFEQLEPTFQTFQLGSLPGSCNWGDSWTIISIVWVTDQQATLNIMTRIFQHERTCGPVLSEEIKSIRQTSQDHGPHFSQKWQNQEIYTNMQESNHALLQPCGYDWALF